jgi:hypothetical protein
LKLGKLFLVEIAVVLVVLVAVVIVVEVNPALASSQTSQIGAYNQKLYDQDTVSISKGQTSTTSFKYSSYEPVILEVDFTFSDVQSPGYISCTCNGRYLGIVYASQNNQHSSMSAVSFSGSDIVKSPSTYSNAYTKQVYFTSFYEQGFEGTFSYQINLKGTR